MAEECTSVSPACPVEDSIYGYIPNLPANIVFTAFYTICTVFHLWAGNSHRTKTFMIALSLGGANEAIGYIGRIIMHYNVYSEPGFNLQLSNIMIGPAFISAGIYLTLKHIVLTFGERYSRARAAWYTWIFISCDCTALAIQAIGGGLAAAGGSDNWSLLQIGTKIMIAGTVFQVVVLVAFGYLLAEYFIRIIRHRRELGPEALSTLSSHSFRWFGGAIVLSFLGILIRSAYRIPELWGGWGSPMMKEELEFIVLEGVMISISMLALTVCHPGWCFPAMCGGFEQKQKDGTLCAKQSNTPEGCLDDCEKADERR